MLVIVTMANAVNITDGLDGLAGGLLLGLAFAGRADNDQSDLIVLDATPTGNPLLDLALRILTPDTPKTPLAQALAQTALHAVEAMDLAFGQLIQKGLLKESGNRLWGGGEKRYVKTSLTAERELRNRIRQVVLSPDEIPDPRDVVRIGLLHACKLSSCLFTSGELELHQGRLLRLGALELINQAVLKAILEFQEASFSQIAERLAGAGHEAPHQTAGGRAAVVSAIAKTYEEAGLLRGSRLRQDSA